MIDGAKLIAHRGAEIVTREQLATFPTPEGTETHKPIPHIELVNTLTEVMGSRALFVEKEQFAVQGSKLFGTFDLQWMKMEEYGAALGFRHANDKSMAIQIAVGARVFVCDNMSFHGELIHTRKHTAKLKLDEELDSVMYLFMKGWQTLKGNIEAQKEAVLEDRKAKTLIYDIFEQRIMPLKLFHPVVSEWKAVAKEEMTGWRLHNVMTANLKAMPPAPAFRATARLGKFMASKF